MKSSPSSKSKNPSHFEMQGHFFLQKETSPLGFAWLMAGILGALAAWTFYSNKPEWYWVSFGVLSASFLILGYLLPDTLISVQKSWGKFGKILEKINNPLWMGILYFIFMSPLGLILRMFNSDFFYRKFRNPKVQSYWTPSTQEDTKGNFLQQF